MNNMVNIVHNNYEKITDDIFWLNQKWVLRFSVRLNKYSDKYGRVNYHKEVMYNRGRDVCINISRSFDYYFTIDSLFKDDNGQKESVYITPMNFIPFRNNFNLALEWFTSSTYQNLFAKKDGKIFIPRSVEPIEMNIADKLIILEPTVNEFNNEQVIGINIFINNYERIFIDVNKLFVICDLLNNFNMFQSAQLMINYVNRPEYGENIFNMSNPDYGTQDNSRTVFKSSNKDNSLSFFDKVNKGKQNK